MNIRTSTEETKRIKEMASFYGMNVSEYVRYVLNEAMEDFYDEKAMKEAREDFKKHPETMTHDEFWKDLV